MESPFVNSPDPFYREKVESQFEPACLLEPAGGTPGGALAWMIGSGRGVLKTKSAGQGKASPLRRGRVARRSCGRGDIPPDRHRLPVRGHGDGPVRGAARPSARLPVRFYGPGRRHLERTRTAAADGNAALPGGGSLQSHRGSRARRPVGRRRETGRAGRRHRRPARGPGQGGELHIAGEDHRFGAALRRRPISRPGARGFRSCPDLPLRKANRQGRPRPFPNPVVPVTPAFGIALRRSPVDLRTTCRAPCKAAA